MGYITNNKRRSPETYPEPRGGPGEALLFARNFASGPLNVTDIDTDPVLIPWAAADVGAPGTTVQITPQVTGVVLISAALTIKNTNPDSSVSVTIVVEIDGSPLFIPLNEIAVLQPSDSVVVPILTEAIGLGTGVPVNVSISLVANFAGRAALQVESSTLELQEVTVASG